MWKSARLAEIAEIEMGQSPPGKNCNTFGEGLPLLNGPTEFSTYHPYPVQYTTDVRKVAYPDDILFCVRGSTTGRMNWADQKYAIGRGIAALRHKSGSKYRYFLKGLVEYKLDNLLAAATGSTFPNVSRRQLENLECVIPPLPEQRAIAHILGAFDDKIELTRKMNQTLEAIARAIFKSWFVDFDPVRAKAEGRVPVGMDAETAALFPDKFVESELGLIPEGWEIGILEDLVNVTSGKRPGNRSKISTEELKIPLYGGGGQMGYVETPLYDESIIITGRVGTLGKVFRITFPCWPSDNTLLFLAQKRFYHEYIYLHLNRVNFLSLNRGSTQPLITQGDMKKLSTLIPPENLIRTFHKVTVALFQKLDLNEEESSTLAELRDTLLPKLISGQLRVPEAEEIMEEAI